MDIKASSLGDVPLILEYIKKLGVDKMINDIFGNHGNQKSLTNGKLAIGWLTHMLTKNNHCKYKVNDWANSNKTALQALLGQTLTNTDFDDCRLGRLVEKFADNDAWHTFERFFYADTMLVLDLDTKAPTNLKDSSCESDEGITKTIKLDSTTSYGHHTIVDEGIMQFGWSKDHRSDLPQVKLMVSVEGNTGISIATDTVSGDIADDLLYRPIIKRTRDIIDTQNSLFLGDCKMSSLETKADIAFNKEFYLTPQQLSNKTMKAEFDALVNDIVNNEQTVNLIFSINKDNKKVMIGAGYETTKKYSFEMSSGEVVEWEERRILVRSNEHAKNEINQFDKKIKKLIKEIEDCKTKQHHSLKEAQDDFNKKLSNIINTEELNSLLEVISEPQIETKKIKRNEVRNGIKREGTYERTTYKITVKKIIINEEKIKDIKRRKGCRVYVTNAPKKYLTFDQAYRLYRESMYVIEIGFHKIKDYLNISPLFVRNEKQIVGLTRFLMLALKILTLMTAELRSAMKKEKIVLKGLYQNLSVKKHEAPTAESILKYFSRQEICLVGINLLVHLASELKNENTDQTLNSNWSWFVPQISQTCMQILQLLQISDAYDKLPVEIARINKMEKIA